MEAESEVIVIVAEVLVQTTSFPVAHHNSTAVAASPPDIPASLYVTANKYALQAEAVHMVACPVLAGRMGRVGGMYS